MGFPNWIREGWLGRVPVRWCEADGPVSAGIVFRVGRVDERLTTTGITHLVEHLAADRAGISRLDANAYVGLELTAFHVRGEADEIRMFLDAVCHALGDLPVDRLDTEMRVLAAELATVPTGISAPLFTMRYGHAGAGLATADELGLRRLSADDVAQWARERFTSDNAALWMTTDPGDSPLPLPAGGPAPVPPAVAIPGLALPAWTEGFRDAVCLTFLGGERPATAAAMSILRTRILDDLRRRSGLVYTVDGDLTWVGDDLHVTVTVPCPYEHAETVCHAVLDALGRLADEPPAAEEVSEALDRWRRAYDDPANRPGLLHEAACRTVLGRTLDPPWSLIPADVSAAVADFKSSLLLAVPERVRPGRGIERYETPSTPTVVGRRVRTKHQIGRLPLPLWRRAGSLIVGDEGVTLDVPGAPATILYDDCEAAVMGSGGSVRLMAGNTRWINVNPAKFVHGEAVVREILEAVGPGRAIPATLGEQRLEEAAGRLGEPGILAEAMRIVATLLAPDEQTELVSRLETGKSAAAAILTDRRVLVVHWRGETVNRIVEVLYQDVDAVRRVSVGDGVSLEMAGAKGVITAASHAEAALIEQTLREGVARAREAALPRGSDDERRAVARSLGKYHGVLGFGAMLGPLTIGYAAAVGEDLMPAGTLLGIAASVTAALVIGYRVRHRFGGVRGALFVWPTWVPVTVLTAIVAAAHSVASG